MTHLEIDMGAPEGDKTTFTVSWHTINGRQLRHFTERKDAEVFALKKMGKTGLIICNLDLTQEQRADLEARRARAREIMAQMEPRP